MKNLLEVNALTCKSKNFLFCSVIFQFSKKKCKKGLIILLKNPIISRSMKKFRKAFSFVELFLVIGILALIAAIFVPAAAKIRDKARRDVIVDNLSAFVAAGQTYVSERGVKRVNYQTLVESKMLKPLESVSGEAYDKLVYDSTSNIVSVTTSIGDKVEKEY